MSDSEDKDKELPCGCSQAVHDARALVVGMLTGNDMAALAVRNLLQAEVEQDDVEAGKELDVIGEVIRDRFNPDELKAMAENGNIGAAAVLSVALNTSIPVEERMRLRKESGTFMRTIHNGDTRIMVMGRGLSGEEDIPDFIKRLLAEAEKELGAKPQPTSLFGFNFDAPPSEA